MVGCRVVLLRLRLVLEPEPAGRGEKRSLQIGKPPLRGRRFQRHHDIHVARKDLLMLPENGSQASLEAIAHHRGAHAARRDNGESR